MMYCTKTDATKPQTKEAAAWLSRASSPPHNQQQEEKLFTPLTAHLLPYYSAYLPVHIDYVLETT